jgi:hypothetical protein
MFLPYASGLSEIGYADLGGQNEKNFTNVRAVDFRRNRRIRGLYRRIRACHPAMRMFKHLSELQRMRRNAGGKPLPRFRGCANLVSRRAVRIRSGWYMQNQSCETDYAKRSSCTRAGISGIDQESDRPLRNERGGSSALD